MRYRRGLRRILGKLAQLISIQKKSPLTTYFRDWYQSRIIKRREESMDGRSDVYFIDDLSDSSIMSKETYDLVSVFVSVRPR